MQRKWILAVLWGLVASSIIGSAVVLAPRLIARQYISQLIPAGTPAADHAYRQLDRMGRWAAPALLDAAEDRDPILADLRQGRITQAVSESSLNAFEAFKQLRESSDIEQRADICAAILFTHWNADIMDERAKRRLLHYVFWAAVEIPPGPHPIDGPQIPMKTYNFTELPRVAKSDHVSLFLKGNVVVGTDHEWRPVSPAGRIEGIAGSNSELPWLDNTTVSPTKSFRGGGSSTGSQSTIDPRALGVGRHAIYVQVSVGFSTESSPDRDKRTPPPWFEVLTFGPTEVEIVDGLSTSPQANDG